MRQSSANPVRNRRQQVDGLKYETEILTGTGCAQYMFDTPNEARIQHYNVVIKPEGLYAAEILNVTSRE